MLVPKKVKIFTIEQQFPCGPKSTCCGPVGQSEQEILALKSAIEKSGLGVDVEIFDLKKLKNPQAYPEAFKLFRSLGPGAIPIIMLGDEIVSIGSSKIDEIITAIKNKEV